MQIYFDKVQIEPTASKIANFEYILNTCKYILNTKTMYIVERRAWHPNNYKGVNTFWRLNNKRLLLIFVSY